MALNTKHRDYLFDNYKALLIVLVVIGHFIEPGYDNNEFLYTLKWLIVSFHMPAFIFISGYFSKRVLSFTTLIQKLAIPYIIYEFIYYLLYVLIIHKPTGLYLMYPKFSLWYIQALFFWRLLTPFVKKIPHYMPLSIIAGLLIGCSDLPGNFLSIPRTLVFFPFFLAGTSFNRETLTQLRSRRNQMIAVFTLAVFTAFLFLDVYHKTLSPKIFYGRYNYHYLEQDYTGGILCRLICYGIGFAMIFVIALLIPEKQTRYSYIGTRTMAVYFCHGLTYQVLKDCTHILQNIDTIPESLLLIAFCVALTVIFSIPQLTTFTSVIADMHLPSPVQHDVWLPRNRYSFQHPITYPMKRHSLSTHLHP